MEVIDYLIQNKILSERKVDDAFAVVRKARVMLAQNKK